MPADREKTDRGKSAPTSKPADESCGNEPYAFGAAEAGPNWMRYEVNVMVADRV